jgi:integrase
MDNSRLRAAAPTSVNVTVGKRSREYLTDREVERLIEAAKQNRAGHRDATAILVAYRHGLRASELVALRWDDIDLATGRLHVRRAKSGNASMHPISARESRALRKLCRLRLNGQALFRIAANIATAGATDDKKRPQARRSGLFECLPRDYRLVGSSIEHHRVVIVVRSR